MSIIFLAFLKKALYNRYYTNTEKGVFLCQNMNRLILIQIH